MNPTVSVVIPTYKRPDFLRRAIHSVLAQTRGDLELIVIENGESREGKDVVQEFQPTDSRLHYFYRPEPDPCLARNVGIQAAHGTYVAFLDNDDEWLPTKLERQITMLESRPDVGLVAVGAYRITPSGSVITEWPDFNGMQAFTYLTNEECAIRSLSGVLIRRECFERVGGFNSDYFVANDFDLYLRIARHYEFALIQEPLYRYYQHAENMTKNLIGVWKESIRVLTLLQPAPELGVTRRTIHRRIARFYYSMAVESLELKQADDATRYYLRAILSNPLIGAQVPWSRYRNPIYRVARPYAALLYCAMATERTRVAPKGSAYANS